MDVTEKRRTPRVYQTLDATLSLNDGPDQKAICRNIGEGGVLIELEMDKVDKIATLINKSEDNPVDIEISLTNEGDKVKATAVVRWKSEIYINEHGKYQLGLEFRDIPLNHKNRIAEYVSEALKWGDHTKYSDIPKNKDAEYNRDFISSRRRWLSWRIGKPLYHTGQYSEAPENMKGNIEHLIGTTQIPIGIAGPIRINGEYARGDFFIPMATTEGALVSTYHRGMRMVSKSGAVNVRIVKDEIHIAPAFYVRSVLEAEELIKWINNNFTEIKKAAENTTKHGKLLRIDPIIEGRRLILKFCYYTGDAQGLNMINRATDAACRFIKERKNKEFMLRSNYSSVKKVAGASIHSGYGKAVFADVVVPRKIVKILEATPEELHRYYHSCLLCSTHAGMIGMTAHTANGIAAIYAACGQDLADISTSHVGISMCEVTEEGDLYVSMYLPNLLVGTVGGGTGLSTQKECLEIMDCYGNGKSLKFAEIIAAVCLVGEIAVLGALVSGRYVEAHEKYGRNRPETKLPSTTSPA